jgi:hypothetical protein
MDTRQARQRIVLVWSLLVTALLAGGAVTLPHTFTNGQTISATEVNANFTALKTAVDALQAALAAAPTTQGLPRSIFRVNPDGTSFNQWHGTGGSATIVRLDTGDYRITLPGEAFDADQDPVLVRPSGPVDVFGEVFAAGTDLRVRWKDAGGNFIDTQFWVFVFNDGNP